MDDELSHRFKTIPTMSLDKAESAANLPIQDGTVPIAFISCRNICKNDWVHSLINYGLTDEHLLLVTDTTLSVSLPFVMLIIGKRFYGLGVQNIQCQNLLKAFFVRIHASRVLKLRFALMIKSGAFDDMWNVRFLYQPECYKVAALERDTMINALDSVDVNFKKVFSNVYSYESIKNDPQFRRQFMLHDVFDPKMGIKLKTRNYRGMAMANSFLASEAVSAIVNRIQCTRDEAVSLLDVLHETGNIKRGIHNDKHFKDNSAVWIYLGNLGHEIENKTEKIDLDIYCDTVDLQSLDFWRNSVFAVDPIKGYCFDSRSIVHPMTPYYSDTTPKVTKIDSNKFACDCFFQVEQVLLPKVDSSVSILFTREPEDRSTTAGSAIIKVVFSSIARPFIVTLREPQLNGNIDEKDSFSEVEPKVIVKKGDNLYQDMMTEIMFRLFNSLWMRSKNKLKNPDYMPYIFAYDVFPTAEKQGFFQAVSGVKSLKEYDWQQWFDTYQDDKPRIKAMVTTAAGSTIGAYVVGARDRHWDNILIKDEYAMLHIDFGYLLGNEPPIDGPRFTISPQMEECFKKLGEWENFLDCCCDAFRILYGYRTQIVRVAQMCFSRAGFKEKAIDEYIRGPSVFNEKVTLEDAVTHLRNKLESSSKDMKNLFKQYSHAKIDPVFYKLLENKFPPAVLAMKIVDMSRDSKTAKVENLDKKAVDDEQAVSSSILSKSSANALAGINLLKKTTSAKSNKSKSDK